MKSLLTVIFLIFACFSIPSSAQAPEAAPAAPAKGVAVVGVPVVGTYDRSSIALAYYRSPLWDAILADRRFELKTVKAANDTARAKELEKYGVESQDLAMQQVFGKSPIDNILAVLAAFTAAATLVVASPITVGLMFDARHQKRSGGQLPSRPPHSARG